MAMFNPTILEHWLSVGLCHGAGDGEGACCIEQAVALGCGLALTDMPEESAFISPYVARFCRLLNDQIWCSPKNRSRGMRRLAYAQVDSSDIDGPRWLIDLTWNLQRRLLPSLLADTRRLLLKKGQRLPAGWRETENECKQAAPNDYSPIHSVILLTTCDEVWSWKSGLIGSIRTCARYLADDSYRESVATSLADYNRNIGFFGYGKVDRFLYLLASVAADVTEEAKRKAAVAS
jgi:hypothetical protein